MQIFFSDFYLNLSVPVAALLYIFSGMVKYMEIIITTWMKNGCLKLNLDKAGGGDGKREMLQKNGC